MRDFKRLQQDPPQGINGSPNPDNIMSWNAVIFGPDDTPWDGGEQPKLPARSMMLQSAVQWLLPSSMVSPLSMSMPLRGSSHPRPLIGCRHLQADPGVLRGVPQQSASREIQVQDVPPKQ